ncbi:Smr/MutS family protein [Chloroflexota bacterium]
MPSDKLYFSVRPVADELRLRHLTVDEALLKLDKYLNDAFMAGLLQVKVIHGKGTGILRQVVRERLAEHSLVASYHPGGYGEGGAGVTMVELAPK